MKAMKVLYFFVCLLWLLGLVGGVGYTIYYGQYPVAIGVATNGVLSFGKVKKMFEHILA